jgi:hypothetical protein
LSTVNTPIGTYNLIVTATAGTISTDLPRYSQPFIAEDFRIAANSLGIRKLGADERKHWIKRLELNWFEKFLMKHI